MPKRPITAEDLLKFQFVGDPQPSPDGSRICFTKKTINAEKNKYETHLWMADTKTGSCEQFTFSEFNEGGSRWSPDGKYIAFTSGRDKPKSQIYIIPTAGGEARKLTDLAEGAVSGFKWSPDSKKICFAFRSNHEDWTDKAKKEREEKGLSTPPLIVTEIWYRLDGDGYFNTQYNQLQTIDVATGEMKEITNERYGATDFDWSPDSKHIVYVVNRSPQPFDTPQLEDLIVLNTETGAERKIEGLPDGPKGTTVWSPDGKKIAYAGHPHVEDWWGGRNYRLYVTNSDGGGCQDLFEELKHDFSLGVSALSDSKEASYSASIEWSKDSSRIFFGVGTEGTVQIASLPATGGEVTWLTTVDGLVEMGGFDAERKTVGLVVSNGAMFAEIACGTVGIDSIETRPITQFNKPLFDELEISRPQAFSVESEPGKKVHAWLMKPAGFQDGKKYPCIVQIHGGPHAQYGNTFFHEFQLLAAQGYVVVFSNPRGSKGYGEAHCNAITGDWGNTDYVDFMAVAEHAKSLPFVDGAKMGVMGGSYGGYMTNWIVGHTNLFKAAITDRSVVSLLSMAGTCDFPFVPDTEWKGNPWDEIDDLWRQSPLKYIKNCKTPTLIIHSEGDLRCPIEQGEQLFAAFKRLGVETKFVRYPQSTTHGLSRMGPPDLRMHRLGQIVDWWKDHFSR